MLLDGNPTIRLNAADDVVIARASLPPGTRLDGEGISTTATVPAGHKVATRPIAPGEPVRRYNQVIGFATTAIAPGDHVHTHNLAMGDFERDYAHASEYRPISPADTPATFMGYRRADGRVATRNYLGVLSSVNCSAHVCRLIAREIEALLGDYPNIDGIVPIQHKTGCCMNATGEPIDVLRRTLGGFAVHPNFHSVLLVGLGCEVNQVDALLDAQGLQQSQQLK
ncbi:MAG: altronate dehydratase, partial [Gammaproteobacteria bacterium]|nr:altronate dehydratase [Gammaproteobacteria bacterium]